METTVRMILSHLQKYQYNRDAIVAHSGSTQVGVSEGVEKDRSYLSRILKELEKEGLIFSEKRHVKGRSQKVKVYYISPQGRSALEDLGKEIEGPSQIKVSSEKPHVENFFGRDNELKRFEKWYETPDSRVLIITGMAGIGKTTFVSNAVDIYAGDKNVFWLRLNSWSSLNSVLLRMSDYLSTLGKKGLKAYIKEKNISIGEVSFLLEKELEEANIFFVFDDYHNVLSEDLRTLLDSFVDFLPRLENAKMVAIGREANHLKYDLQDLALTNIVQEITIEELDEKSCKQLLESKGVDKNLFFDIYKTSRGNPMAISLISLSGGEGFRLAARYVEETIISNITDDEKTVLEIASILRYPERLEAFLEIAHELGHIDADYKTIEQLTRKSFMYTTEEAFGIHELIKSFLNKRIHPSIRRDIHHETARYYQREHKHIPRNLVEIVYHLGEAEKEEEMAKALVEHGKFLVDAGYWKEILTAIDQGTTYTSDGILPHLLIQKAYILSDILGEPKEAIRLYEKAKEIFTKNEDKEGEAEADVGIGHCLVNMGKHEKALAYLDMSIEISLQLKNEEALPDAYHEKSRSLFRLGRLDEATEELDKAIHYHERTGKGNIHRLNMSRSSIYVFKGDRKKGIDILDDIIEDLDKDKEVYLLLRALSLKGSNSFAAGEYEYALDNFEKAAVIAEDKGHMPTLSHVLSNLAETYLEIGELEKAEENSERAIPITTKLGEPIIYENSLMTHARILHAKGKLEESEIHFKKALSLEINALYMRCQTLCFYASLLSDTERKKEAKEFFQQSLDLVEELGSDRMEKLVKKEMKKKGF